MLSSASSLFMLRDLSFAHFNFPRWQSLLVITLIGVVSGLDSAVRAPPSGLVASEAGSPLWLAVLFATVLTWVSFLIILAVLRWWMRRGGRWDGQGDLFNLLAASWLVPDLLGAGLVALGVPSLLVLPLWLYSVWVGGNALSGAIPKAGLGYSIGGIALGILPVLLLYGLVGTAAALLGAVPPAGG